MSLIPSQHRFFGHIPRDPVRWPGLEFLEYIRPVEGWTLWTRDEQDGDGFWTPYYFARHEEFGDVLLHTSRFRFTPSQDRFAWFVRNGFPRREGQILGPWDDTEIEVLIAAERSAA